MKKVKRERNIPVLVMVTEAEKKKILANSKKSRNKILYKLYSQDGSTWLDLEKRLF